MTFSIAAYLRSSIAELKRVNWPSREKTIRLTAYVVLTSGAVAAYLGILDYVLFKLISAALGRK